MIPTDCTNLEFLLKPEANSSYTFQRHMEPSKSYCLNIFGPYKFLTDLYTNPHNELFYYQNGDATKGKKLDSKVETYTNMLSLKITNLNFQGFSNASVFLLMEDTLFLKAYIMMSR